MNAPTPLEAWIQIAREHAANTTAAIEEQRAVRLARRLEDYGQALGELALDHGEPGAARDEDGSA